MKILVVPEDSTQMETGRELLVDPLPADVKAKVVWRENFWLTDEAISTEAAAHGTSGGRCLSGEQFTRAAPAS